jgi:chromosome segregation ATPase
MPKKKKKKTSKKKTIKRARKKVRKAREPARVKKTSNEFLSSALREIEQQLDALKAQKKAMERELYLLALDFNDTQNEENALRDKISKLVQKEAQLNTKKTRIKEEMQALQEKINKVTKINAEMRGME